MRRAKGRRLSKRACTRCTPEIDAGSTRVTNRWKASRTRESTVLQWCGGTSGLDPPDRCCARSSARRRPEDDEASDPSPSVTARSREHSVRQRDPLAEVSPASLKRGARRHHRLCRNERRWLPGAWVLVFDNVGCISRPDASRIASRSRRSERVAAGEPARGEPRHLRLWVSRSEASDGRAKLSTLRGQPGGQNRAAKEHFAKHPRTTEGASGRR